MIKRDFYGYIVDDTEDGGDSANRSGLWKLFKGHDSPLKDPAFWLEDFVLPNGICVRHPNQAPWNNPKNFSRDQLIPLCAGLWKVKRHDLVRSILWSHIKRGFFCQNIERDEPGSKKYPWPHNYLNDKGKYEKKLFDFADPLLPHDIFFLIMCAKLYVLYPLWIICAPFFVLSLFIHGLSDTNDEGQVIAQCKVYGNWAVRLYKYWRPDFKRRLLVYWQARRNQEEIAHLIINDLEKIK